MIDGRGVAHMDERLGAYTIRSANELDDVPKVATLVDAAYGHYVERIGMLPRPMTDDYAEVITNRQVTVAESHGTLVGVIVLTVDEEGFLIDKTSPSIPPIVGEGSEGPSSSPQKPKPGAQDSIPFISIHTRR